MFLGSWSKHDPIRVAKILCSNHSGRPFELFILSFFSRLLLCALRPRVPRRHHIAILQISNGSIWNCYLKTCASKNIPWGNTLLPTFFHDDNVTWSTGAPTERGHGEQNCFAAFFRWGNSYVLRSSLVGPNQSRGIVAIFQLFSTRIAYVIASKVTYCSSRHNILHPEKNPNSMFCDWSGTLITNN